MDKYVDPECKECGGTGWSVSISVEDITGVEDETRCICWITNKAEAEGESAFEDKREQELD